MQNKISNNKIKNIIRGIINNLTKIRGGKFDENFWFFFYTHRKKRNLLPFFFVFFLFYLDYYYYY